MGQRLSKEMEKKMTKEEGIEELKGLFGEVFLAICPDGAMKEVTSNRRTNQAYFLIFIINTDWVE